MVYKTKIGLSYHQKFICPYLQISGNIGFSKLINSVASIGSTIIYSGVFKIQSNKTKVIKCRHSVGALNGLAIFQPIDSQFGISDWDQFGLKMCGWTLHCGHIPHGWGELGGLSGETFIMWNLRRKIIFISRLKFIQSYGCQVCTTLLVKV